MLKKFRRRFILITMVLVGIVSFIAFAVVGFNNYSTMKGDVDHTLEMAVSDTGSMQSFPGFGHGKGGGDGWHGQGQRMRNIPVLAVTIYLDNPGYIVTDASSTAVIEDSDTLQDVVTAALADGAESGKLADYGLYYRLSTGSMSYRIAFVSASQVEGELLQSLGVLAALWAVLMLAIFAITVFLSRFATRPVERAWKDQQRFIADASHELKTPLTIIMADAAILADNPDATVREQGAWVEGISAEATRMQHLTEDMLTLAQADAGIDTKQLMADVDLSSAVEGQVLQFDAVAFERGLTIEGEVEEGLHVQGDEMRLESAFKTILENACKYSEQPGTIALKLVRAKNQAVLTVHNGGDPIPSEDLPHLFDRFYRSDKARTHEGEAASFGLGLSIAKSTVEMHGGTIAAASDASGTTFTIKLPLAK